MDETILEKKIDQAMNHSIPGTTEHLENRMTDVLGKIIAVRHAESIANTQGVYQGQTYDTELSDLGKKQAEALANRLTFKGGTLQGLPAGKTSMNISRIISSPLKRTYQTAMEISKLSDCPVEVSDLIVETNHGEWEGLSKTKIMEDYSHIYNLWLQHPSGAIFPGGEAFVETLGRVEQFLETSSFDDGTVVVTHDNIVRIMVTLANGWTLDDIWTHDIEPATLNIFEVNKINNKNRLKILKLNDNIHLEGIRADLGKHAL